MPRWLRPAPTVAVSSKKTTAVTPAPEKLRQQKGVDFLLEKPPQGAPLN